MADTVTPLPPTEDPAANATIVYTFEEQATSSCVLYGLSLFCLIIGGIRSARTVRRTISRGQHKMENSIRLKEARWFPLTASAVLFGLYCFFNPDKMTWDNVKAHVPGGYADYLQPLREKYVDWQSRGPSTPLYERVLVHFPENVRVVIDEFVETAILPLWALVPTITKAHCMTFLLVLLCVEGCVSLAALLKPFFSFFLRLLPIGQRWPKVRIPYLLSLKKGKKEMEEGDIEDAKTKETEYLLKIEWDTHDTVAIAVCLLIAVSHLYRRHWITNNILGVAFSIYGIENLHLSSFKAGTCLLIGLFFYDIFWVFATDVMTTVAKGIDAPILLQFPQDIYRNGWLEANKYSMLGLGDIVIPGLFIALLRRFDQRVGEMEFIEKGTKGSDKKGAAQPEKKKWRIYFYVTIVAYALGLLLTMAVMHHFKRAQPALLYLVPTCLLIPLFFSVLRGEFSTLWNYSEDHLVESDDDKKKEEEKKKDEKKKN